METLESTNQLQKIVSESNLDKSKSEVLLEKFSNYFEIAAEWERKIKDITVTNVSQVAEMKMNREARLFLKNKRIEIESTRKSLKEESLREGQTIDSIAKILKNLIEPLEDICEKNEKFKEIKDAQEKLVRQQERLNKLLPYNVAVDAALIGNMDESMFDNYFNGVVKAQNDRIEAELKAEQERLAAIEADKRRQAEIQAENERLKLEAEAKEKALAIEREKVATEKRLAEEKSAKERAAIEAKAKAERLEAEKKAAAERKIQEEKIAIEKQKADKLAAELKAKQEAELKAKAEAEAKEKAEKIAADKAAKAPKKQKLNIWIDGFVMGAPTGLNEDATVLEILEKFNGFKSWAKTKIDSL